MAWHRVRPFEVKEAGGNIAPLLDVRRVGGAHERFTHLFGNRGERTADDLDGDGIEGRMLGGWGCGFVHSSSVGANRVRAQRKG